MLQLGARYYWPEVGRFISQDPIGEGSNWYAYVGNRPTVSTDPDGQVLVVSIIAGGMVVVLLTSWIIGWYQGTECEPHLHHPRPEGSQPTRAVPVSR